MSEATHPAASPPKRPVHVYTFKIVTHVALSDAKLDGLAEEFENVAPVKIRAIPDAPGVIEDAGDYGLDEWFAGEETRDDG